MAMTWDQVRDRLTTDLGALTEAQSLVVAEPDPPPGPAPERKWWHLAAPKPRQQAGRYVQVFRMEQDLLCECASAAYCDVPPEQGRALVELGWSDPETHPARWSSENHVFWGKAEDPETTAGMLVAGLQALGTGPPDEHWRWETVS